MKKKTNIKYTTAKIPEGITELIDLLIKTEKFTSRTDVIKHCIRKYANERGIKNDIIKT